MPIRSYLGKTEGLSNTTPSTGRGGQLIQLISLSPGNIYKLKDWSPRRVEGVVLLKVAVD